MTSLVVVVPTDAMIRAGGGQPLRERAVAGRADDHHALTFERAGRRRLRCRAAASARRRQPARKPDAGMLDRADDHHAGGARIAECVMMLVPNAEELRQYVEPVAGQFGPGTLRHPYAVEPRRLDDGASMRGAGRTERALVEEGVRDGDPA